MNEVYMYVYVPRARARACVFVCVCVYVCVCVCVCVHVDEIGVWMIFVQKETSHGVMSLPVSPQEWNKFLVIEFSLGQQIRVKILTKICKIFVYLISELHWIWQTVGWFARSLLETLIFK